ncbi:hypothetical protein T231_15315 [Tannerella sp. oral taxon BU063 isolate Cell 6/7/9]|uniref:Uncharacterized protein n=1 Tax=Tannerella sp. oral taxon BU063 isolate Cell 6/7/9 TaxID=1411021 RepID=W2CLD2_9BACT|nr:hypothetical protein T231_15315 [Tannerella sp. oral taxon BU063 isolate Cell 6/7/9]
MPILCVKTTIFVSLSMQGSAEVFLMTLKASPKSLARTKSLFVFASDFWYSSMIFC